MRQFAMRYEKDHTFINRIQEVIQNYPVFVDTSVIFSQAGLLYIAHANKYSDGISLFASIPNIKSRYNKNISSICILCETGDENIYHFLLVCSSLKSTRERHLLYLSRLDTDWVISCTLPYIMWL
jgi:hypothetical protein